MLGRARNYTTLLTIFFIIFLKEKKDGNTVDNEKFIDYDNALGVKSGRS